MNKKHFSEQYKRTTQNYNTSKKRKIKASEWIVIVLMAFWTLASVFGSIAFFRGNSSSVDMLQASAATTTYDSSSTETEYMIDPQGLDGVTLGDGVNSYGVVLLDNITFGLWTNGSITTFSVYYRDYEEFWFSSVKSFFTDFTSVTSQTIYPYTYNGLAGGFYVSGWTVRIHNDDSFTSLPLSVYIETINYTFYSGEKFTLDFEFLDPVNSDDYHIFVDFDFSQISTSLTTFYSPYLYNVNNGSYDPQLYNESVFEQSTVFSNKNAIDQAYASGLAESEQYWQNQVETAFQNGKSQGIDIGYLQGINDANTYSFSGLLSAVIDVPIKAFSSMFDFEFLGVNLAQFGFSILSLMVVVTIIKFLI